MFVHRLPMAFHGKGEKAFYKEINIKTTHLCSLSYLCKGVSLFTRGNIKGLSQSAMHRMLPQSGFESATTLRTLYLKCPILFQNIYSWICTCTRHMGDNFSQHLAC